MDDERLRRLKDLANSRPKKEVSNYKQGRSKVQAAVIYRRHELKIDKETVETLRETSELRKQLKALALEKQRENEKNHIVPLPNLILVNVDDDEKNDAAEDFNEPLLRPVFVPKDKRSEITENSSKDPTEKSKEAHEMLIEYVRRDYEAIYKNSSNEESNMDPSVVDDTDGLNEEEEDEAWKLRELLRLKRDRAERERLERERIELERIRNMTEEERRKLDEEKMKMWMERPQGQMRFMQKYYHKGAFFMDGDNKLYDRDYTQATGEDVNTNREMLPEVKQVRDFGKKGRTKWTHLVGEDTTAFDYGWGQKKNELNYKLVGKMAGMKGHMENPAKRSKK